jgi:hypothetical protein
MRMRKALVSLLAIQAGITLAIAAGFSVYQGLLSGAAVAFGGAIALGVSGLLAWRLYRAARPGAMPLGLMIGPVERMLFVAGAFALAIAGLGLPPLPLIVGFAGAEMGYFLAAGILRGKTGTQGD